MILWIITAWVAADEVIDGLSGKVVAIEDGDTVIVETGQHLLRLQLEGIDAPEAKSNPKLKFDVKRTGYRAKELKALGKQAKRFLKEQLLSKTIKIHLHEQEDKYGRHPAELFINDQSINQLLVASGYARPLGNRWWEDYQRAKKEHLGLWQEPFSAMMEAWAEEKMQ